MVYPVVHRIPDLAQEHAGSECIVYQVQDRTVFLHERYTLCKKWILFTGSKGARLSEWQLLHLFGFAHPRLISVIAVSIGMSDTMKMRSVSAEGVPKKWKRMTIRSVGSVPVGAFCGVEHADAGIVSEDALVQTLPLANQNGVVHGVPPKRIHEFVGKRDSAPTK